MVQFGKVWVINTAEDLTAALEALDTAQFYAEMSDDFSAWRRETDEVERQRRQVMVAAREVGLTLTEVEG